MTEIENIDWSEFNRVNEEIRKKFGKPLIDTQTLAMIRDIKAGNGDKYKCRIADEHINRTDGKVTVVNPFKGTYKVMEEDEYEAMMEKEHSEKIERAAEIHKLVHGSVEEEVTTDPSSKPLEIEE